MRNYTGKVSPPAVSNGSWRGVMLCLSDERHREQAAIGREPRAGYTIMSSAKGTTAAQAGQGTRMTLPR